MSSVEMCGGSNRNIRGMDYRLFVNEGSKLDESIRKGASVR